MSTENAVKENQTWLTHRQRNCAYKVCEPGMITQRGKPSKRDYDETRDLFMTRGICQRRPKGRMFYMFSERDPNIGIL